MKNSLTKKVFGRVSVVHGVVIVLTLLMPFMRGCVRKKPDVITFIDLSGAPAAAPEPEPETPAEEPEIKPKPVPKPEPKIEKPELKIPQTNTPPKKAENKKPAVTNAPPKPKTEAEKLAEIRQKNKVRNPNAPVAPAKKQLDLSGLKSALNSSANSPSKSGPGSGFGTGTGSGSGGGGVYSPFAGYYDSVKQQMYAVWQQPSGAPIGLTATAIVRVEKDGAVYVKSISKRSGNAQFDQSVQNALNSTVRLPIPPADLPDRNISIEFCLSD